MKSLLIPMLVIPFKVPMKKRFKKEVYNLQVRRITGCMKAGSDLSR